MKRYFLKLSLCLSIISNFLSACGNEELMSKLEDVESYLCEAPDSALSVLDSIPEESLSSGKLRAKYALLRSIALDKNYIDVTSDSIIRPAVEYYSRRGSAKERLETYYYRGTISFNGGDLDSAADWFVKGCQFAGKSGVPPRMSAMIYFSLYLVYDAVYDYGKAYTSMLCAYDYFCEAEDVEFIIESLDNAVRAGLILDRYDDAEALLDKMREYRPVMDQFQLGKLYASVIQLRKSRKNFDSGIVDEYFSCVRDSSCIDWLTLGDFYYCAGDYDKAKEFLENYEGDKESSEIYNSIMSHILYELGDYKGAYDCYSRYVHITDDKEEVALESDVSFKEERLLSELAVVKHKNVIITTILVIIVFALFVVCLLLWMRHFVVHAKERQKKLAEENETLAELVEKAKSKIERLQKIRQKKLDPLAIEMIDERLVLLNKCVIGNVCGNMENEARKAIKVLTEDHDRFLLSTRAAFMLSHSDVLSLMKKKGLNEEELNISCLYGMGMNSEDVAKYLGMKQKQVYSFNMSIRTKLGIARNDSGLPDYMVKQFALKVRSDKSTEEKLQES